jgi:hypothetical protein
MAAIAAPKMSFETLDMISSSAGGNKTMLVILAQKIGLHRRKFHHAFARRGRLREYREVAEAISVIASPLAGQCRPSSRSFSQNEFFSTWVSVSRANGG